MTPTPTSGAADLPDAMHMAELLENPINVVCQKTAAAVLRHQHSELERLHALAAGQATAAQQGVAYAALPTSSYAGRVHEEGFLIGTCPLYTADQLHAFADATCALRASRGKAPAETEFPVSAQADSVLAVSDLPPLPAPDLRDVGTKPQEIKEFLKGYATEYARTAIAARAPADSVQEDAARYRFLRDGEWRDTDLEPFIRLQLNTLWDAKIDAARKQGANHDR